MIKIFLYFQENSINARGSHVSMVSASKPSMIFPGDGNARVPDRDIMAGSVTKVSSARLL